MLMTEKQVLDFGAARDGVPEAQRGRRVLVNREGVEVDEEYFIMGDQMAVIEQEAGPMIAAMEAEGV